MDDALRHSIKKSLQMLRVERLCIHVETGLFNLVTEDTTDDPNRNGQIIISSLPKSLAELASFFTLSTSVPFLVLEPQDYPFGEVAYF